MRPEGSYFRGSSWVSPAPSFDLDSIKTVISNCSMYALELVHPEGAARLSAERIRNIRTKGYSHDQRPNFRLLAGTVRRVFRLIVKSSHRWRLLLMRLAFNLFSPLVFLAIVELVLRLLTTGHIYLFEENPH